MLKPSITTLCKNAPAHLFLGQVSYAHARTVQEQQVAECINGGEEIIITCEHLPVITLGRRVTAAEENSIASVFAARSVPVQRVRRGGRGTLHLPGQLVIYPVLSLRRRRLGVRSFVESGLKALNCLAARLNVVASEHLDNPGLWTNDGQRKLGAVGLEIIQGVTNHGFSLNIDCDLTHFRLFLPCGINGEAISSLRAESLGQTEFPPLSELAVLAYEELSSELSKVTKT